MGDESIDAELDGVAAGRDGVDLRLDGRICEVWEGEADEVGAGSWQSAWLARDPVDESAHGSPELPDLGMGAGMGREERVVGALGVPGPASLPHGEDLLVVGGPHSVFILQEGDRVGDIAVQVQDDAPLADVGLEHGPGLRGLDDASARGDDEALPVGFDGLAGVYGLPAAELGPSVLVHELLDRHSGLLGLEVVVQVQKLHVELLCHDVGHGGLATGTHSDQDDGPVGIWRRYRSCRGLLSGLAAVETHAELRMQHVPPAGPRLGCAAAVLDDHGGPAHSGKQREAHGHPVVVVRGHAGAWLLQLVQLYSVHHQSVVKLRDLDAELRQLLPHGCNPVALLDPLVGNARDGRVSGGHSCHDGCREERIGHGLHVDVAEGLQVAHRGALDGGGELVLVHLAAHGTQHAGGEPGIALE